VTDEQQSQRIALMERDIIGISRDLGKLGAQVSKNEITVDELKKEFNLMKTDIVVIKEKMDSIFKFLWVIIGTLVALGGGVMVTVIQHVLIGK